MLLTVAILSYNRPKELSRCLSSLGDLTDDVNVVIYDDCSPRQNEILLEINKYLQNGKITIVCNQSNIGYDANLFNAITASKGKYVLLMSDDDIFEPEAVTHIIDNLNDLDTPVAFVRYLEFINNTMTSPSHLSCRRRRSWDSNIKLKPGIVTSNGSILYNSILFSGLIFNRNAVTELADKFKCYLNSIYIQVAIFAVLTDRYGATYICGPGVIVGGDGENGFGLNSTSTDDIDLADRSNILSNLNFNKRLLNVIDNLSIDFGKLFLKTFYREFNFRNISGMRYAREMGPKYLMLYWSRLSEITRYRSIYYYIIYVLMLILPKNIVRNISAMVETMANYIRSY